MDISKWNTNQIMQLPDWCFGGRYWVGEYMGGTLGVVEYKSGQEVLPHRFVLWGIMLSARSPNCLEALRLTIRLAGSAPSSATNAETMALLLDGISTAGTVYEFYPVQNGVTWIGPIRQLVEPNGRKLSMVSNGDQAITYEMTVGLLISAVPTEIPDWLVKGMNY